MAEKLIYFTKVYKVKLVFFSRLESRLHKVTKSLNVAEANPLEEKDNTKSKSFHQSEIHLKNFNKDLRRVKSWPTSNNNPSIFSIKNGSRQRQKRISLNALEKESGNFEESSSMDNQA